MIPEGCMTFCSVHHTVILLCFLVSRLPRLLLVLYHNKGAERNFPVSAPHASVGDTHPERDFWVSGQTSNWTKVCLFPRVIALVCTLCNRACKCLHSHFPPTLGIVRLPNFLTLTPAKWYIVVVFFCISLNTHELMHLLACTSFMFLNLIACLYLCPFVW